LPLSVASFSCHAHTRDTTGGGRRQIEGEGEGEGEGEEEGGPDIRKAAT